MNRDEFELMFAQNNLVALDWFHRVGMFAIPCKCGRKYCEGWIMQSILNMTTEQRMQVPQEHWAKYINNVHEYIHAKGEFDGMDKGRE